MERKDGKRTVSGWHALLLGVLAVEILSGFLFHASREELRAALEEETGRSQVEALFVLSNRDGCEGFHREAVQDLLNTDNPLVRERIMTSNFDRFGGSPMKEAAIQSLKDGEEAFRCRFLLEHQIGKRNAMTLAGLSRFIGP